MRKLLSLIIVMYYCISIYSQNIECVGNTIQIPLSGFKIGNIQWQFSTDKKNWINITGQTTTRLQTIISESGYFRAKITYGQCDYFSDTTSIQAYPVPTISNAGLDQTITNLDTIVTLSANTPAIGNGKWSIISGVGGSFENDTLPSTKFKGKPCNSYILRWTISTACLSKNDDVNIWLHAEPTVAKAGNTIISNSDTTVLLAANRPTIGKGKWTILLGEGGSFSNDTAYNSSFTGRNYTYYTLKWNISTECKESFDTIIVSFNYFVADTDGNLYTTVKIDTQTWLVENLKTTKYNDGTLIPNVTNQSAWEALTTPAYCWYLNNESYKNPYGALYNWYTVNTGKLCPTGWHVPTHAEWTILTNYLGGESIAGGKLKESGTNHWKTPNAGGDNSSGFTALPGGYLEDYYGFNPVGAHGVWWSATEGDSSTAWMRYLHFQSIQVLKNNSKKLKGFSVRCLKND